MNGGPEHGLVQEIPDSAVARRCVDCGRHYFTYHALQDHADKWHPDSPRRPYDVPLWES